MKINDIYESTTSGAVATVSSPIGGMKSRGQGVYPNQKSGNLLKGKKTKGKFPNGLSEDELAEQDLILVPGQGTKVKPGFIPHDKDRTDHEVEMARSDLFQCAKDAKTIYDLISDLTEDDGLPGWVQAKITKANDYLNSVREHLEHKTHMHEESGSSENMSVGGQVWRKAMDFPFVVRATKDNVKNELIGSYKTKEEAKAAAKTYPDAKIYNNVSGKVIESAGEDWGSMGKKEFKHKEMQHELGHEDDPNFERKIRQQQMDRDRGPWYIKIDGKVFKQKGEPKVFDWRKGANNYALAILKSKPELQGKVTLTKKLPDTSIKKEAKDFAQTKHKGFPEKPRKDNK